MSPVNALIFGLGLFFLGLRLVGENLTRLSGGGLRNGISLTTRRPVLRMALGVAAGALMQSATAVTFICVSMVAAGLIGTSAASAIIIWCNVGLTALAFVATLDIHPAVAFVVGGSGIVLGVVHAKSWQTVAGVLLGMGLILLGLQQMGAGAAPLKDVPWMQTTIAAATASPPLAFLVGVLAAAILQSNTGATMMIIALAGAGAVPFDAAALLIYGTNLGAIALRLVLAAGMRGESLRLVRLEDLFCVASGLVMMLLFYAESVGVPLVFALAHHITPATPAALAVVFLLSNLVPAALLAPLLPQCQKLLEILWPGTTQPVPGTPHFLSPQALAHPSTAMDLIRRELARLMRFTPLTPAPDPDRQTNFQSLAAAIEDFIVRLAAREGLNEKQTESLHRLRAALSGIRHLEDAAGFYAARAAASTATDACERLNAMLASFVTGASDALDHMDAGALGDLAASSKRHGPFMESLRREVFPDNTPASDINTAALFEDFQLVAWTFHHLAQILATAIPAENSPAQTSLRNRTNTTPA